MALNNHNQALAAAVDAAAKSLVSVAERFGSLYITMPLHYPSGANVVIRVDQEGGGNECFVSDFGLGFTEADLIGASSIYGKHARVIAGHAGVGFDENAFFVARASRNALAGVVAAVANCSLEAVSISAYKLSEKKVAEDAFRLYERLVTVFTPKLVARDVDIHGASHTPWHVANVVTKDGHVTIFEPVSKHPTSIATATTKFHDIALLDNPPNRVAVVRRKDDFGTYLNVLSQAANVISRDAADSVIKKLAA